jgi:hypothetical protein
MWRPRFLCYVQGGKVKFKTRCFFFMEHWLLYHSGLLV